ncbi:MAG TPA: Hsp20/alpha crystallin family protein [Mycobacteriales bacterium]|jgi:HSP20 family protein|nr:Hsp20/alpha crystallin family protein [Mycobacteriales bacterium]
MALNVWDPFSTLARLDRDFDEIVRRAWGARGQGQQPAAARTFGYVPPVELARNGEDVLIRLELPGVDVERDVEIEVSEGRLMISGRREDRFESEDQPGQVLVRELRYGSFRREFQLPEGVGADDVEASYDRGMLEVRVRHVSKPTAAPTKVAIRSAKEPKSIEAEPASSEKKK